MPTLTGAGVPPLSAAEVLREMTRRYRRDLARARARVAAGHLIDTRCGPVEYATAGHGPPVLLVHGAGGGFDQGLLLGAPLAEHGHLVIAMSRFGYLRTPLPDHASARAQADAHAALLDALGIERAAVVAVSAGALSGLQLAIRHPARVTRLALVVPAVYAPRLRDKPPVRIPRGTLWLFDAALRSDLLAWSLPRTGLGIVIRNALGTAPELLDLAGAPEQARIGALLQGALPVGARRLGLLFDAAQTSHMQRYELERITCPVLAIGAADDPRGTYDRARYTAQQIAQARFIGYPSGGHALVGRQDAVNAELDAFLRPPPAARGHQPTRRSAICTALSAAPLRN
jgi:2-hydroxy-6-oxonona-2,4-dienedioate hydrolase